MPKILRIARKPFQPFLTWRENRRIAKAVERRADVMRYREERGL